MTKIKDAIPLDLGIFQAMEQGQSPIIWADRYDSDDMDLEFLTSFGEKTASPLLRYFIKEDGQVDNDGMARLSKMVYNKFKENWTRRYEVLTAQYNILDNYNMIEAENMDRSSLETTIRDLMRTNVAAATQINDLLEAIENNNTNTSTKTGTESTENTGSSNLNGSVAEVGSVTTSQDDTDTINFVDRRDTETRDMSKITSENRTDTESKTDELSFLNRKDSRTGQTDTTTDGTEISGSTETGTNSQQSDNSKQVFGYNATVSGGSPAESNEGLETTNSSVDKDTTTTTNSTSGATSTDDTTKTGTETNTVAGTLNVDGEGTERDSGTVTNSKSGQEVNTKSSDGTNTTDNSVTTESTSTDSGNSTTTFNTTDTATDSGDVSRVNTGTVTNNTSTDEQENDNAETTGTVTEVRGLTRKGNIGVTTSQQLMQQHIEFWRYSFLDDVYRDVVGMLGLAVYSNE